MPPEKHSTHPVVHVKPSSPPRFPRPSTCTRAQVTNAPAGAARLKKARCVRAVRFERPCLRSTEVRPKAAGALCSMIAMKTTSVRDVDGAVDEAPSAMPSAHACTTSPMVVADVVLRRVEGAMGVGVRRAGDEGTLMAPKLMVDALCGPRARFEREMCMG